MTSIIAPLDLSSNDCDMPKQSYFICATPRTGSNLLCEALWATGIAGHPIEHFLSFGKVISPSHSVERLGATYIEGSSENGVFGTKVMAEYFSTIIDHLRAIGGETAPVGQLLANFFPNLRYIHVSRKDKIRQAISLEKAIQTNQWVCDKGNFSKMVIRGAPTTVGVWYRDFLEQLKQQSGVEKAPLCYNFDRLLAHYEGIIRGEKIWTDYFHAAGVTPFEIVYEDLATNKSQVVKALLDYLDLTATDPSVFELEGLQRQYDAINNEWAEYFMRDLTAQGLNAKTQ